MKRRTFTQLAVTNALCASMAPAVFSRTNNNPKKRIGLTSAIFRYQFAGSTESGISIGKPLLDVMNYPEYVTDRFGIHNIEYHSGQLKNRDPKYLKELRKSIEKHKCTLLNIQGPTEDIATEDEKKRQKAVEVCKSWIDSSAILGAKSIRINTGRSMSMKSLLRSFKELNRYAGEKGVSLLVENHGGLSDDPDNLIKVIQETPGPKIYANPDFGNFAENIRYPGLKKLLPYTNHIVCAKVTRFDGNWNHIDFDFDKCFRIYEDSGFKGVYSGEQWHQEIQSDYEKIADWIIEHVKENIS